MKYDCILTTSMGRTKHRRVIASDTDEALELIGEYVGNVIRGYTVKSITPLKKGTIIHPWRRQKIGSAILGEKE